MYKNISGVILAGGTNKRFGGLTKSNIVLNGKTIIARITETLGEVFSELIIVTNTPTEFAGYSQFKIIGDIHRGAGPLGGIQAALKTASGEAIFVFAGDMPFLNKDLIINQIEFYFNNKTDILIPEINSNIEPLHAIYNISVTEELDRYLQSNQNKAVREFFKLVNTGYLHLDDTQETRKAFTNINSPSDIVFY